LPERICVIVPFAVMVFTTSRSIIARIAKGVNEQYMAQNALAVYSKARDVIFLAMSVIACERAVVTKGSIRINIIGTCLVVGDKGAIYDINCGAMINQYTCSCLATSVKTVR